MRSLVYSLLVVTTLVAVVLGVRLWRGGGTPQPTPPPTNAPPERCDELQGPTPRVAPEQWAGPLAVISAVPVTVDGKPAEKLVTPGEHVIAAGQASVKVRADAFHAVVVLVRVVAGVEALLVLGAPCADCEHAAGELNFDFKPGSVGSVAAMATALSKADWQTAVTSLRAITPEERGNTDVMFLLAIIHQLAGHLSDAREQLDAFPATDPVHVALKSLDKVEDPKKVLERQAATLPMRWNSLSERYERISDAFVGDAPVPMGELSTAFGRYSQRMMSAVTDRKVQDGEVVLDEATRALDEAITRLRAMRTDCDWQRRVWKAL